MQPDNCDGFWSCACRSPLLRRFRDGMICWCDGKEGRVGFAPPSLFAFRPPPAQEITIAETRSPLGASQMTFERTACAIRLKGRIEAQNNARDFAPISVVSFGIEKAHISNGVLLVVRRELGSTRRQICNLGIGLHAWISYQTEKRR
ncbi:protein of unknown function [Bradyrhizobium vignae]|uniref:Uncharacterized protein n=1 Tax=Bradyrhizobium vignae TaxID=1549949 RepID=A0A2U3Q9H8_9BRAD|nr:protein of unknown function [Bradyrhizobium vignae]